MVVCRWKNQKDIQTEDQRIQKQLFINAIQRLIPLLWSMFHFYKMLIELNVEKPTNGDCRAWSWDLNYELADLTFKWDLLSNTWFSQTKHLISTFQWLSHIIPPGKSPHMVLEFHAYAHRLGKYAGYCCVLIAWNRYKHLANVLLTLIATCSLYECSVSK
jgi:hypothetical protein